MGDIRTVETSDDRPRLPPARFPPADAERLRFVRWLVDNGRLSDWRSAEPARQPRPAG
jgi:hypothetical protein